MKNLKIIYDLQEKYNIEHKEFEQKLIDLKEFRVVTLMIGKFSTGKSSLLNSLFGKNYLGTKLTPETSIPTEITYGVSEKALIYRGKEVTIIPIENFVGTRYKFDEVDKVQLVLSDEFLKTIPTVKIVDMPGFDSGIALHNAAIDKYLPESRSYMLTFSANDPYVPESIIDFLSELKFHEIPVFIVITKAKSVTETQLQECIENIRKSVEKYLGWSKVEIVVTNAKGKEIIVEPLKKILRQIESDSHNIFTSEVIALAEQESERLILYLKSIIRQIELTPSEFEFELQKGQCKKNLEKMKEKMTRTKKEFSVQISSFTDIVKSEISESLYNSASTLEIMLMNGTDINNKVNLIVRESIIKAMKTEFEPKLRKYLEKMTEIIQIEVSADTNLQLDESQIIVDNVAKETIKKAIPTILASIGLVLSGPISAVAILVTGLLVEIGFMKKQQEDRRQLAQEKIYDELIPQVVNKAGESVSCAIDEQIHKINCIIEGEAQKQIELQEKALADIIRNINLENEARNQKLGEVHADLKIIEKLMEAVK